MLVLDGSEFVTTTEGEKLTLYWFADTAESPSPNIFVGFRDHIANIHRQSIAEGLVMSASVLRRVVDGMEAPKP